MAGFLTILRAISATGALFFVSTTAFAIHPPPRNICVTVSPSLGPAHADPVFSQFLDMGGRGKLIEVHGRDREYRGPYLLASMIPLRIEKGRNNTNFMMAAKARVAAEELVSGADRLLKTPITLLIAPSQPHNIGVTLTSDHPVMEAIVNAVPEVKDAPNGILATPDTGGSTLVHERRHLADFGLLKSPELNQLQEFALENLTGWEYKVVMGAAAEIRASYDEIEALNDDALRAKTMKVRNRKQDKKLHPRLPLIERLFLEPTQREEFVEANRVICNRYEEAHRARLKWIEDHTDREGNAELPMELYLESELSLIDVYLHSFLFRLDTVLTAMRSTSAKKFNALRPYLVEAAPAEGPLSLSVLLPKFFQNADRLSDLPFFLPN